MKRNLLSLLVLIATCGLFNIATVDAQTLMSMPGHSSYYGTYARGYWFTAPTDFVISGLRVPVEAGSGGQYIQVVKYSSPPNTGCCTSPSFTTEFFVANAPDGVIQNTNIVVTAGEYIGVIGTGGTVGTSYTASGIHATTINGQPTNLYRMGYQGPMAATAHTSNLWGQTTSGQIGRVELYWSPPSTAPNDAGVASVDSPATFCDGAQNIVATIKNYGVNQVNNVTVNWSFNGVLQTPISHTTLLDTFGGTGSQTAQIVLGTKTFVANQTDDIEVWTSMPNGVVDTVTMNDTAMASVQPSLNGTFTINPGGIGATNYLYLCGCGKRFEYLWSMRSGNL